MEIYQQDKGQSKLDRPEWRNFPWFFPVFFFSCCNQIVILSAEKQVWARDREALKCCRLALLSQVLGSGGQLEEMQWNGLFILPPEELEDEMFYHGTYRWLMQCCSAFISMCSSVCSSNFFALHYMLATPWRSPS